MTLTHTAPFCYMFHTPYVMHCHCHHLFYPSFPFSPFMCITYILMTLFYSVLYCSVSDTLCHALSLSSLIIPSLPLFSLHVYHIYSHDLILFYPLLFHMFQTPYVMHCHCHHLFYPSLPFSLLTCTTYILMTLFRPAPFCSIYFRHLRSSTATVITCFTLSAPFLPLHLIHSYVYILMTLFYSIPFCSICFSYPTSSTATVITCFTLSTPFRHSHVLHTYIFS